MKFMKIGSKADSFQALGSIRSVASEIPSDFAVAIDGVVFHLHMFPLLSKSTKLQRLAVEARGSHQVELINLPGGVEAFELCAKFCYGVIFTLNAFNVVAVRCAADYLGMTEAVDKGNLIFKTEVFLNCSIFRGWTDSIIALRRSQELLPWAEDLKVVSRCIDAIASKTLVDPSKVDWSFTYSRAEVAKDYGTTEITQSPPWNGIQRRQLQSVPKDWWVEDTIELEIDLYWRVIVAIKSTGRMLHNLIGEALRLYALKWLPGLSKDQNLAEPMSWNGVALAGDYAQVAARHRQLLEKIVSLMPLEKGSTTCSFLLKLLKASVILGASLSSRSELARRVGLQLEEASPNDLLIPSLSCANDCRYDVDLVLSIVEHYMMQDQSPPTSPNRLQHSYEKRRTRSAENINFVESRRSTSTTHSSKLRVAEIIDGYLAEIARDIHLPISKFILLAESIPVFARPIHDGLYRAIDIYLKEHPGLTKSERKKICRVLNCKKLSMDACMHAAQNERLPLRVVVQVLFFEQVRAAMTGKILLHELPTNVKALLSSQEDDSHEGSSVALGDGWEAMHENLKTLSGDLVNMKMRIAEAEKERTDIEQEVVKTFKSKGIFSMPSKPRKFFCRLWPVKAFGFSESRRNRASSTRP